MNCDMKKIKISRNDIIIFNGYGKWTDDIIECEDQTIIYYSESEIVIKRITPRYGQFIYAKEEKTIHTIDTEYGIIQLNVNTIDIQISINKIEITYILESEMNKLIIEGV